MPRHTPLKAVYYYQCVQSQWLLTLTCRENLQNIFHTGRIVQTLVTMVMYICIFYLSSCGLTMPPSDTSDGPAHQGTTTKSRNGIFTLNTSNLVAREKLQPTQLSFLCTSMCKQLYRSMFNLNFLLKVRFNCECLSLCQHCDSLVNCPGCLPPPPAQRQLELQMSGSWWRVYSIYQHHVVDGQRMSFLKVKDANII